jgi:ligand-binding sensor domain-containing protein
MTFAPFLGTVLALVGACGLLGAEMPRPAGTNLPSASGEYLIRQWTSNDGLPQNSVIAMAQTTDGYLWLATFGGLARFDGVRFEVFDPDRVPGLESYYLYLVADLENGLWLSRSDGPASHYADGQFRRLTGADGLPKGEASSIRMAPDGTVWAGSTDGRLFRRAQGKFTEAVPAPDTDWGNMWNFGFDHQGRIWCETRGQPGWNCPPTASRAAPSSRAPTAPRCCWTGTAASCTAGMPAP